MLLLIAVRIIGSNKPKYFMAYEIPWMIGHFNNNPWMLQDYQLVHHFDEEGHPMDSIMLDESKYPKGITGFFLLRRREPLNEEQSSL